MTNVNFEDERVFEIIDDPKRPEYPHVTKFIECLGLCHTVITDEKEKNGEKYRVYNASSPDELALVNGMRHFGFAFHDRDLDDNMIIKMTRTGQELKFKLLHVIEFNSDRKRMSVIVRDQDNKVVIYCKGADSKIKERLAPDQEFLDATQSHVD